MRRVFSSAHSFVHNNDRKKSVGGDIVYWWNRPRLAKITYSGGKNTRQGKDHMSARHKIFAVLSHIAV
jgi:hypothetical protein